MKKLIVSMAVFLGCVGSVLAIDKFELSVLNFGFTGDVEIGAAKITSATVGDITITSGTFVNGIVNVPISYVDLAAKSQTAIMGNGTAVSSITLAAGGTTYITADLTQPGVPRNIVIVATGGADVTGTTTMTILSGSCYVAGINSLGISTNEYITIVSTANAAAGRGNIAWASISSITIRGLVFENVPNEVIYINVGTSDKIGLFNNVAASGDILKVVEAGANSTTYTVSAVYDTITFAAAPDSSKDYMVIHNVTKTPKNP